MHAQPPQHCGAGQAAARPLCSGSSSSGMSSSVLDPNPNPCPLVSRSAPAALRVVQQRHVQQRSGPYTLTLIPNMCGAAPAVLGVVQQRHVQQHACGERRQRPAGRQPLQQVVHRGQQRRGHLPAACTAPQYNELGQTFRAGMLGQQQRSAIPCLGLGVQALQGLGSRMDQFPNLQRRIHLPAACTAPLQQQPS